MHACMDENSTHLPLIAEPAGQPVYNETETPSHPQLLRVLRAEAIVIGHLPARWPSSENGSIIDSAPVNGVTRSFSLLFYA